ncbi:class I SAM-dependent methyltransferase [Salinirussus salinus]|jgi:SAM-dependent methyltransferase|uniref:class I SAM-dependent methyltransferase n=1 Tax=Salinirussus salinus TaxID=1198300 RepID=UPI0013577DDA|nr:class I SAM-dependent methyltransferase [Salinirussus salinus]
MPADTVREAVADRPVEGAVCLEAGAGTGRMSAALLEAGAAAVYAVTDDPDHAAAVRERFDDRRLTVLRGDVRTTPLPADSVDLVTAHALFNVLPPAAATAVAAELTRVVRPGADLVVDDYAPVPASAPVRRLFAVENAAAELAGGEPALTFYPAAGLRRLFAGHGWRRDRTRTLLDPVPWHADLVDAHLSVVRETVADLEDGLTDELLAEARRRADAARDTSVGEMYSLALSLPAEPE